MEYLYWLSVLIVPGLPALGLGLMGLSPPEFGLARTCFIVAAVWTMAVGSVWLWKADTDQSIRVVAGILIGAIVFVGLPELLRRIGRRELLLHPQCHVSVRTRFSRDSKRTAFRGSFTGSRAAKFVQQK